MYENEIVSVIIPVYNSSKYIDKTIHSVLEQTYENIEVVIIDDCSSDNSRQIIEQYAEKYENIICHIQNKNQGVAVARNKALELAKGKYVAFLDSDDLWYPQKVDKQIKLMKKNKASICFTAIEMIDEKDRVIKGKRKVKEKIDYKFLLRNTMIATSSVVIDRNIVGEFRMPLIRSGQDYATWLQLMRGGFVAYGIDEVLVKYRVGKKSLSSNKFKSIKQVYGIQVVNERIHPLRAGVNTVWFGVNAVRKYFI